MRTMCLQDTNYTFIWYCKDSRLQVSDRLFTKQEWQSSAFENEKRLEIWKLSMSFVYASLGPTSENKKIFQILQLSKLSLLHF